MFGHKISTAECYKNEHSSVTTFILALVDGSFSQVQSQVLISTSHFLKDFYILLLCFNRCHVSSTQNQEYKLRFTASEWARIADELTRERGLWGPLNPCHLDKWTLDSVEGTYHYKIVIY